MENLDETQKNDQEFRGGSKGRVLAGLFIIIAGVLVFARQAGAMLPHWIFSWEFILIGVGLFIGARRSFRGGGWLIPIIIGAAFMLGDMFPELHLKHYIWPLVIIGIGVMMIIRPRKKCGPYKWQNRHERWNKDAFKEHVHRNYGTPGDSEDYLDMVSIFGSIEKTVTTSSFKGGDIVSVFGGTNVDLSRSDIQGTIVLEATQVFGGTKLIVPSHWTVKQSEMVSIMGGIEDKRRHTGTSSPDPQKVLILRGTSVFGGLEITD